MSKKQSNISTPVQTKDSKPSSKASATIDQHSLNPKKENEWYYIIGLAIILMMIVVIRKNFLDIPFERDEGSYMYSGKSILDGAIPFKDIGSQRLDGVFYMYALLVKIFGYKIQSMQIGFIILNLASTTMLYFMMRKLVNPLIGFASAIMFAILSMNPYICGFTIQSEHIVCFFITGAFLSFVYFLENKKIWVLILSGILFSFAFEVKQTSAFYGMLAGLMLIIHPLATQQKNWKKIILSISIFSMAVIIPIIIDLWVVYQRGAWTDFNLWFFDVRKQYSSLFGLKEGVDNFVAYYGGVYLDYEYFWIMSFIGTILIFFTKLPVWKKILIFGLNIAGFLTIVPGYHFYGHYFIMWVPAVAINGAAVNYTLKEFLQSKFQQQALINGLPLAILILPILFHLNKMSEYYFEPDHDKIIRHVYSTNPFVESKMVAEKLNTLMKKEDKLAVFGTEIEMYVYTNKVSPSRFAGCGALLEFPIKESKKWQEEFIHDVEKAAPKYLVFYNNPFSWMTHPKAENLLMPFFNAFIKTQYELIGYADMLPQGTKYVWKPEAELYNVGPKGQLQIYIFERKP